MTPDASHETTSPRVQNAPELTGHGLRAMRRDALAIVERVLAEANPFEPALQALSLVEDQLVVGGRSYPMTGARIWFLGAGKASYEIARAVEARLGARLSGGLLVCKPDEVRTLRSIDVWSASHPIPSDASVCAGMDMLERARLARPGDIVICGFTGGSSSLVTAPCEGVTLEDLAILTQRLLTCGADIVEINAVRKHVSRLGGGRLGEAFPSGVHLINLTVSDVVGDALDYITDPTVADTSTVDDARRTLDRYRLWDALPDRVCAFFGPGGGVRETPKSLPWPNTASIVLRSAASVVDSACRAAEQLGYRAITLSSSFDGESQALGRVFAAIAREVALSGRPLEAPCALIGGGETIVRMEGFGGLGGPNQEFALAAAAALPAGREIVVLGLDTDGTDGPTEFAGGLCDSETTRAAESLKIDIRSVLSRHDATDALQQLGDAIRTGATGSNVNDLKLMLLR